MTLRVVFLGSSQNVFSQRFYAALVETPCEVVAVVDVPAANRSSTNPATSRGSLTFAQDAARRGRRSTNRRTPTRWTSSTRCGRWRRTCSSRPAYLFRLKAEILGVPRIVAANVHASLLPAYRGRSPVFWALRHGERISGLTIHSMDDRLDTGELLYQVRVPTRKDDTVASLYDRIIAKGVRLVPRLVADAGRNRLPRRPQPAEGGSYFSAAKEADFHLDWSRGSEQLRRWIVITPGKCFATAERRASSSSTPRRRESRRGRPGNAVGHGPSRLHRRHRPGGAADRRDPPSARSRNADGRILPPGGAGRWRPPLRVYCTAGRRQRGLTMPLVPFRQLMADAEAGGYAVGYFESWNLESLLAVAEAAEAARSPVILGFSGIALGDTRRVAHDPLSVVAAMGLGRAAA